MALQGKDGGTWKDASAVYGKSSGSWLYAKEVFAKNAGTWSRAWTDCRKYDAGGRDWSAPSDVVTYSGSCNNRTQTTTTTRTKTGCPDDVRAVTISSPDCNSSCFTSATSIVYSGSCSSRSYVTRTTYTANAGSGCTSYHTDSAPTADPDCTSSGTLTPVNGLIVQVSNFGGGQDHRIYSSFFNAWAVCNASGTYTWTVGNCGGGCSSNPCYVFSTSITYCGGGSDCYTAVGYAQLGACGFFCGAAGSC